MTPLEISFTKVVFFCKDRSKVMPLQVGYNFHQSSYPTTAWNSLKKDLAQYSMEWTNDTLEEISFTNIISLFKDRERIILIQVGNNS